MPKQPKRIAAALLASLLLFSGCTGGVTQTVPGQQTQTSQTSQSSSAGDSSAVSTGIELPEDGNFKGSYTPSSDKYRTFYEIFAYSFYDSNGDGIGDINGITSKLDYLNDGDASTTDDLGIEGIWLMPIMPSPSYHKYNISNYKDIDPQYGTLDDFKNFVSEAHKRNINVIIDFVINHTSREHEWYKKAIEELKAGKSDGYAQYYHFSQTNPGHGWKESDAKGWFYECEFDTDMPDLNLTNETVRHELEDIVKFWIDIGVDGFRLDAVMWFESTGHKDSIADLKWLYDYAKSVKPDVYMVGECWTDFSVMVDYYESGVDSFFNFDEQGPTGVVASSVQKKNALGYVNKVVSFQDSIAEKNPSGINTPFISNHDTARSAGFLMNDTVKKMAAALYIVAPGNPFIYYGEEIGMTGSENDPAKRTGMYWESKDAEGYVKKIPGSTNKEVPDKSVKEQLEDEDSLLSFYKRAVRLKSQNPEIARGKASAVDLGCDETAGLLCDYNGSKALVIYNTDSKTAKVTVPEDALKISSVSGYLIADSGDAAGGGKSGGSTIDQLFGSSSKTEESSEAETQEESGSFAVNGQEVTMPAYSVIVLK